MGTNYGSEDPTQRVTYYYDGNFPRAVLTLRRPANTRPEGLRSILRLGPLRYSNLAHLVRRDADLQQLLQLTSQSVPYAAEHDVQLVSDTE